MQLPLRTLLVVSLAINAALLFTLAPGLVSRVEPSASGAVTSSRQTKAKKMDGTVWQSLETDNLPTLVERLRRAGFPAAVIREFVVSRVEEIFAARRRTLDPGAATRPFWKTNSLDDKLQIALDRLRLEQQQMLRALLGADADNASPMAHILQRSQYGDLTPSQIARVRGIAERYDELRKQSLPGIVSTPQEGAKWLALVQAQRSATAEALGPEDFARYELYSSSAARTIRSWLAGFDASEAEFLAVYRVMHDFNLRFPNAPVESPTDQKARNDAYPELNAQVAATLGPARFAEFERSRNDGYQQTAKLVTRLELPPQAANEVYAVQQDIQSRATALQASRALAPEDRNTQLAALAAEAQTKVTAVLGSSGYEAYKQYGGSWLQSLQPRSIPNAKSP